MEEKHPLSYSSLTLLKNCSMKYYNYKVAQVAKDPDSEDNMEAFNVGKAFHWILEESKHTEENLDKLLEQAIKAFEVEDHKSMLHAMVLRYVKLHQKSGLQLIKCELGLETDIFIGFVDAIMLDPNTNKWYIVDLKTAKILPKTTFARLKTDTQLNLYSYFKDDIALLLGLDRSNFGGARYRVVTKSSLTQKATESYHAHVIRTAKNIKAYDIIIPASQLDPKGAFQEFKKAHTKSMKLRKGTLKPEKNLSYCDSFFRPCEYWSQCHKDTFTKCKDELEVITENV
jgi:hypothetical protein